MPNRGKSAHAKRREERACQTAGNGGGVRGFDGGPRHPSLIFPRMPSPGSLRVIDAAEDFAASVNRLLKSRAKPLTYADQLRRSAGSVGANLVEGYGRGSGSDRLNRYRTAKAECEEALSWLRGAYRLGEIPAKDFFTLSNRGIVIARMISALIN
jgi:four helix bundle protein